MKKYKTKDIYEAAWIYSQQIPLVELEPDIKYFWFVFEEKIKCQELSREYWSQKAEGNIKQYVNSLKTLKDMIFSK